MSVTIKRSVDPSALVWSNSVGSTIPILRALLVTGQGWTEPFTSAGNIAVFKQPTGTNGFYLRVDDNNSTATYIRGYETMSDLNTGTNPFPTVAQLASGLVLSRPTTAAAWPYTCIARGGGFWWYGIFSVSNYSSVIGMQDFYSYKSGDAYNTVIFGDTSVGGIGQFVTLNQYDFQTSPGQYFARSYTQTVGAVASGRHANGNLLSTVLGTGVATYPMPSNGSVLLSPIWVNEGAGASERGYLRGIWASGHPFGTLSMGSTLSITAGALSGKTFEYVCGATAAQGGFWLETSDTWGGIY